MEQVRAPLRALHPPWYAPLDPTGRATRGPAITRQGRRRRSGATWRKGARAGRATRELLVTAAHAPPRPPAAPCPARQDGDSGRRGARAKRDRLIWPMARQGPFRTRRRGRPLLRAHGACLSALHSRARRPCSPCQMLAKRGRRSDLLGIGATMCPLPSKITRDDPPIIRDCPPLPSNITREVLA